VSCLLEVGEIWGTNKISAMHLDDNLKTYTVKEVAGILKVSKTAVQQLEKVKALMPIDWSETVNKQRKRRRPIRYSHEQVLKFLNGGK
jgi:hypothetical protein